LREFWCPTPLKPKQNHEKLKKSLVLKRKIERKFWKLSAPSQIVAGLLRLKHNFKKTYVVPFFFLKNKIGRDFCGSLHKIAAP
jgi:hypothetical protein